jgi:hypothetical protein
MSGDRKRLVLTALAVVVGLVGAFFLFRMLVPEHYAAQVQGKWVRFAIESGFIFWYLLASYRKLYRSYQFWMVYGMVCLVHIFAVGHLFQMYPGGKSLVTFGAIAVADFVLMGLIIHWTLGVWPNHVSLDIGRRDDAPSTQKPE